MPEQRLLQGVRVRNLIRKRRRPFKEEKKEKSHVRKGVAKG